ncbi:MAG: cell division protein FtsW [Ruminococcaceae bacterium]|nr:cell division protein FtsW [Oscillospiraceae bacterium]
MSMPLSGRKKTAGTFKEKLILKDSAYFAKGNIDLVFLFLVLVLFAFGIVMMYSASYAFSEANKGGSEVLLRSQLERGAIGFVLMAVLSKVDYKLLNGRPALLVFFGTVALLVLTLVLNFGATDSQTKRWISIGPLQVQPSEFAKFALIIVLAYMINVMQKPLMSKTDRHIRLEKGRDNLTSAEERFFSFGTTCFRACVLLSAVICLFCGLVFLESHYSCTILLFTVGVLMLWVSGAKGRYFALVFTLVAAAVTVVLLKPEILEGFGFASSRIESFINKDTADADSRYQTLNGLYAIGSGGLLGVGLGNSMQKQLYIPEPQNDFIFPVICEELGFVGASAVLILFAALIARGCYIALKCRNYFGALLVTGIMIQLGIQVIFNIFVVTDIFPNTGISLPFFSYGGTALIVLLAQMGVVLCVSRDCNIEKR